MLGRTNLRFCPSVVEEREKAAAATPFLLPLPLEDLGCEGVVVFALVE